MIRLLNRRFVPFYFDMTDVGVAADSKAREFLRERRPDEHDIQETINPHILFISPEGEVIDELHGYSHPDTALDKLRSLLVRFPQYAAPYPDELEAETPEARARILIDLYELDEAQRVLAGAESEEARYLRGHLARLQGDVAGLRANLGELSDGPRALDARLETAYGLFLEHSFPALQTALADFPATHPRASEAKYMVGLALYHQGRKREARDHWGKMVGSCSVSPWVYRADWAHFCTTFEMTRLDAGQEERVMDAFGDYTPLNRHGYGYRSHPDLKLERSRAVFDAVSDPPGEEH